MNKENKKRPIDPADLVPGHSRRRWAREAGISADLIDSIAIGRRAMTERVRFALAEAAGVPPHWVETLIDATRRAS